MYGTGGGDGLLGTDFVPVSAVENEARVLAHLFSVNCTSKSFTKRIKVKEINIWQRNTWSASASVCQTGRYFSGYPRKYYWQQPSGQIPPI